MKVFLIILAVLALLVLIIFSISAEFTIIFDNGWTTKIKVLFIEKDIKLTQLLSFIVRPDKAGEEAAEESKEKKQKKKEEKEAKAKEKEEAKAAEEEKTAEEKAEEPAPESAEDTAEKAEDAADTSDGKADEKQEEKKEKPNFIKKILDEDGVVGLLLLISNVVQTLNKATLTLIKGLHIYSLYVKMIIGGGEPADIGEKYGHICGWYYPIKGLILNGMKVDNYDDYIQADFIAPRSEYELQLIGSLSVWTLVKVLFKAGAVFVINYLKNK